MSKCEGDEEEGGEDNPINTQTSPTKRHGAKCHELQLENNPLTSDL